jgi:glycosyltransferase involved in cell wall biosynthesis
MDPAAIDILMSTYRGEKYLGEQVESLLGQTCGEWRLLVRDDGSADDTIGLLRRLEESHPGRIRLLEAGENVGPRDSFSLLAKESTAEYAMFCDQDDVWLPGKVMKSLSRIREMEELHGKDTPILLFADMEVVDEGGKVVAGSFWGYSHLDPRATSLNRLLLLNVGAGCTMIMNRTLLRLALPVPSEAVMHDYWCILVASAIGKVSYLAEATVRYRQHPESCLGARPVPPVKPADLFWLFLGLPARLLARQSSLAERHAPYRRQATVLLERYGPRMEREKKTVVEDFLRMGDCGSLRRMGLMFRHGMFPYRLTQNIEFLLGL